MEIPKAGAEYTYWTVVSADPITSTPQVAFTRKGYKTDGTTLWTAAEWTTAPGTSRTLRALVAGPDKDPLPVNAIQLRSGDYDTWIRFDQNPETIIRQGSSALTVQ